MSWPASSYFTTETAKSRGRAGGLARGVWAKLRGKVLWETRFPSVPAAIARTIYKRGYDSGYVRGWHRAKAKFETQAFDQGYRQAQLDAMRRRG